MSESVEKIKKIDLETHIYNVLNSMPKKRGTGEEVSEAAFENPNTMVANLILGVLQKQKLIKKSDDKPAIWSVALKTKSKKEVDSDSEDSEGSELSDSETKLCPKSIGKQIAEKRDIAKTQREKNKNKVIKALNASKYTKTKEIASEVNMTVKEVNSILYELEKQNEVKKRADEDGKNPRWRLTKTE